MGYINNIEPVAFIAGQLADSNPYSIISNANTYTTGIPFGVAMKLDSTDQGYDLPVSSGDITNRMAVNLIINRNKFYQNDVALNPLITGNTTVPVGSEAAGLTFGYVAVTVEQAVLLGDPCFIRFANGNGGFVQKGAFRKDADTVSAAATAAVHPTWYYASAATAGSIAIVCVK
jgi:hypothetical protein